MKNGDMGFSFLSYSVLSFPCKLTCDHRTHRNGNGHCLECSLSALFITALAITSHSALPPSETLSSRGTPSYAPGPSVQSQSKPLSSSVDRSAPPLPSNVSMFSNALSKLSQSGDSLLNSPLSDPVDGVCSVPAGMAAAVADAVVEGRGPLVLGPPRSLLMAGWGEAASIEGTETGGSAGTDGEVPALCEGLALGFMVPV